MPTNHTLSDTLKFGPEISMGDWDFDHSKGQPIIAYSSHVDMDIQDMFFYLLFVRRHTNFG